ncbi:MAG: MATE family efflux transporter [Thermoplasmata archaeon]|nr:MAG: MATE family efflux transporter [Thermoplasmata archaeon]
MNQTQQKENKETTPQTQGVKTLLGDPKKAIIKLSIPMIIAMSAHTLYNLADGLWVSGFGQEIFTSEVIADVGPDALTAVGFVLPFFMMLYAISTGVGVGGSAALSRKIGEKNKEGADNVAIHSIIYTMILGVIFSTILFVSSESIFSFMGAQKTATMTVSYAKIIFAGGIFLFFTNVANSILRGEGDTKRAMYAMLFGSILNIFLDPIFIYTFKMGVTGAAYATILSMAITSIMLLYWLFLRKNTYVSFNFRDFKFSKKISLDIFKVGLPASVQQLSMSITMLVIQLIITRITLAGEDGIMIYTAGWRIIMVAVLPLIGMVTAVISVTGAAYGAKEYEKLRTAYFYAIKIGLIGEIIIAIIVFAFAPQISNIFTSTPEGFRIQAGLIDFLRITCLFYPGAAFGMMASAMFQGAGKGNYALIATILRTIMLSIPIAFIFTFYLNMDIIGVWWALVISNLFGSIISFAWAKSFVDKIIRSDKTNIKQEI